MLIIIPGKSRFQFIKQILVIILCHGMFLGITSCREKKQSPSQQKHPLKEDTKADFVAIFDGKSLSGWDYDPTHWSVNNGLLVGEVTSKNPLKSNTFIIWQEGLPADFELKLEFRISGSGNSGINYRSTQLDTIPYALKGYQADIDGKNRYTGQNYEERKRTTLAYRGEKVRISAYKESHDPGSLKSHIKNNAWQKREIIASLGNEKELQSKIKVEDWNSAHLKVKGNRMQHYINDILMSDVTDLDTINRKLSGYLGLQLHVGPPMRVEYRNIRIKEY